MTIFASFKYLGIECDNRYDAWIIHHNQIEGFVNIKLHYEKNKCFAISLAIQFLSCRSHLQFIVFICCEC
jgi:hypothetical protein